MVLILRKKENIPDKASAFEKEYFSSIKQAISFVSSAACDSNIVPSISSVSAL